MILAKFAKFQDFYSFQCNRDSPMLNLNFLLKTIRKYQPKILRWRFLFLKAQSVPDPAWSRVAPDWIFSDTEKIDTVETNEMESFRYRVPHGLLPKDGAELPPIKLSPFQVPLTLPQMPQAVIIEARAKDWSDTAIDFNLCFLPTSIFQPNDFNKPFVLSKTEFKAIQISPEILNELQK